MIDCYKLNGDGGEEDDRDHDHHHHLGSTTLVSLRGAKRVEPPVTSSWKALKNEEMTPSPPPPTSSSHRITLQDLRAKLSKLLGPRREREYCNVFSSFLIGSVSKSELDRRLTQTLGRNNISLHNQIVRAILSSSLSSHSPPRDDFSSDTSSPNSLKRKSDGFVYYEEQEGGGLLKRFKVKDEDVQEGEEVEAPLGLPLCVQSIGGASREASPLRSWSRLHSLEEEEDEDDGVLPDTDSLRKRMQRLVEQAGLHGLSREAALVLSHAVDHHLRRLIEACIRVKKSITVRRQGERINIVDLKSAMELQPPRKLGENSPLLVEKLSILAFERLDTEQTL